MNSNRTRVVILRLGSEDLQELEKQALQDRLSTNSLITQILKSHLEWDRIAPRIGLIPFQKRIVKDFIDHTPEDKMKEIAFRNADASIEDLYKFTRKITLESFLLLTRLRLGRSGFAFTQNTDEEGNLILTTQHCMGHRWSDFFNAYNGRILERLGYLVETESRENLWIAKIQMN